MKKVTFTLLLLSLGIQAQTKRDPRVVAMAGAYTTIADGIFSVGYNPGMIGLQQNLPVPALPTLLNHLLVVLSTEKPLLRSYVSPFWSDSLDIW